MDSNVFVFSDAVYARIKWFLTIVLPAFTALYIGLGQFWELPNPEAVVGTVSLVGTFLGVCLGISSKQYNQLPPPTDGTILYEELEEGLDLTFETEADMDELVHKDTITFQVVPKHG
jgi:hypothetical protein